MDTATAHKILDIQDSARTDEQYLALLPEYKYKQKAFLSLLGSLDQRQQDIINDYCGVCIAMHIRLLELACHDKK